MMPKQTIRCACADPDKCEGSFTHYTTVRRMNNKKYCDPCLRKRAAERTKNYAQKLKEGDPIKYQAYLVKKRKRDLAHYHKYK